jgi:vancomycin permeability regulator SanA
MKKELKRKIIIIGLVIIGIIFVIFSNIFVISASKEYINAPINQNMDAILVLGCAVWEDKPSPMLKDRLDRAIELYNDGYAGKIIMSGDKTGADHSEVNTMKKYAIEHGVNSKDIFPDYYGLSTYDSIYRAANIYKVRNLIVVSQKYHLYRAVTIGRFQEMNIYGISSEGNNYIGQFSRELREILARTKDLIKCSYKPKATYYIGVEDINDSGDLSNDNYMIQYLLKKK